MTYTFLDRIGRVCPSFGADLMSGLSLASDFLNIVIFFLRKRVRDDVACMAVKMRQISGAGTCFGGFGFAGA
jgi:hypothetical protein